VADECHGAHHRVRRRWDVSILRHPVGNDGRRDQARLGDDGDDSPDAVFNSTGYVDGDRYAVAILTDGSPETYGQPISSVVTEQAQALMPGGRLDARAGHDPVLSSVAVTASGSTVYLTGSAVDPDARSAAVPIRVSEDGRTVVGATTTAATHEFDVDFAAPDGTHTYTVTVGNVGEGAAVSRVTAPVSVNGDPSGAIDAVSTGLGKITITGQEADPNTSEPRLEISVDGAAPIVRLTSIPEYRITVPTSPGPHEITVTYLHSSDGQDVTEGAWAVRVPPPDRAARVTVSSAAVAVPTLLLGFVLGYRWLLRRRRLTVG
jgi:hypothetical protein